MGKKYLGKTMLLAVLPTTLLGASLPAQAAGILPDELVMAQPREIGIVKMNCQFMTSPNRSASCLGDVFMRMGYDPEITLAPQKSTNERAWSNVVSWADGGSKGLTKGRFATPDYDYRCKLTTKVYNSPGDYVTTYAQCSDTISY